MNKIKETINDFRIFWSTQPKSKKIQLIAVILFVLVIPLTVGGALTIQSIRSRAGYPITPPITPPTSRPTLTPTSRPTTKPTATATATVAPNTKPVISTNSLPLGNIRVRYSATITSYDLNKNDVLILDTAGLPTEIGVQNCNTYVKNNRKIIECIYSGIPTKRGRFNVKTTVKDQKGGIAIKSFILAIY